MRHLGTCLLLWLLCSNIFGCKSWNNATGYAYPVYADDENGVAAVKHKFKELNKVTHIATKDFSVQVLVGPDNPSQPLTPLTQYREGKVVDLFYMASEGYIILGRSTDWLGSASGGSVTNLSYEKIELDGTITSIAGGTFPVAISCNEQGSAATSPPVRAIPNPDGTVLALFESETSCTERVQTVTFYDAAHLTIIGGPYDVPDLPPDEFGGTVSWRTIDMSWTQGGQFATSYWGYGPDFDHYTASIFEPTIGLQADQVLAIDCFHPPTTSSFVNAMGESLEIDEETGLLSSGASAGPGSLGPAPIDTGALAFGCQE